MRLRTVSNVPYLINHRGDLARDKKNFKIINMSAIL